jgi:AcrR family transcriptional regulator
MARPPSITDEQILEAAREVFFRDGVHATTAEIARVAGVSEGTIFRRFPTKQELFMAAMGVHGPPAWVLRVEALATSEDRGSLRENLLVIADEMLDFFGQLIPKMNLILSCGKDAGPAMLFDENNQPPPVRGVKALRSYLSVEAEAGRLVVDEPEIVAKMFLGALWQYAFWDFCGLHRVLPMARDTYVRGAVDTFLRAMAPPVYPTHE